MSRLPFDDGDVVTVSSMNLYIKVVSQGKNGPYELQLIPKQLDKNVEPSSILFKLIHKGSNCWALRSGKGVYLSVNKDKIIEAKTNFPGKACTFEMHGIDPSKVLLFSPVTNGYVQWNVNSFSATGQLDEKTQTKEMEFEIARV